MRKRFESAAVWALHRISRARRLGGWRWALWAPFRALAVLFGFGSSGRLALYRWGVLPSAEVPSFVISIGNLSSGGSGKTPLCLKLAQILKEHATTAIISRGYCGTLSRSGARVNDRLGPLFGTNLIGDEPHYLASRIDVPIYIDANRLRGARAAVAEFRPRVLLLDDGYQHRALRRQSDLLLIEAGDLSPSALCMPAGPMRNRWHESARAELIVLTGLTSMGQWTAARGALDPWTRAPIVGARTHLRALMPLSLWRAQYLARNYQEDWTPPPHPRRAFAFCALARPERFVKTLTLAGVDVVGKDFMPDHASPTFDERTRIWRRAQRCDAEAVICTEKDAVKWPPHPDDHAVLVARTALCIDYNAEAWQLYCEDVIQRICGHATPNGDLT